MSNRVIHFNNNLSGNRIQKQYTYADLSMSSKNGSNNVFRDIDIEAVKNAVRNIFTWEQGERILYPDFGNTLRKYLYESITDTNIEAIIAECQMLIAKWEPRVTIDNIYRVNSSQDVENNQVSIVVVWHVPSLQNTNQEVIQINQEIRVL